MDLDGPEKTTRKWRSGLKKSVIFYGWNKKQGFGDLSGTNWGRLQNMSHNHFNVLTITKSQTGFYKIDI